jgi:hypothetical protein
VLPRRQFIRTGTAASHQAEADSLADPKDKIARYSTLKEALLENQRGNTARAIEIDRRSDRSVTPLAGVYSRLNRPRDAEREAALAR